MMNYEWKNKCSEFINGDGLRIYDEIIMPHLFMDGYVLWIQRYMIYEWSNNVEVLWDEYIWMNNGYAYESDDICLMEGDAIRC